MKILNNYRPFQLLFYGIHLWLFGYSDIKSATMEKNLNNFAVKFFVV